jgi:predicted RNase H-like HicB family nuclease
MFENYIAFIHKDPDSDFGISFPDFPGVVTAGETLNAAVGLAHEALTLHIEGMIEDGEEIPPPSTFEQITTKAKDHYNALVLVPVLLDTQKTARVNVSFPEDVLAQIDEYAKNHGLTRSGFLTQAARQAIKVGRLG